MSRAGVRGPLFISVGKPAQLDQFLNLNPELRGTPRLLALIDDSTAFDAYRRAGFNYNMGDMPLKRPPPFKPPTMAPGKWLSYLGNVAQLAPAAALLWGFLGHEVQRQQHQDDGDDFY